MATSNLSAPARAWVDGQIAKMVATGWLIRAGVATLVFILSFIQVRRGFADWGAYLVPLVIYAGICGVFAALSRSQPTTRFAPIAAALDVAIITFMQSRSMPDSPHPAGVAGFTLGIFVLLVAVNGLALRALITWATAVFSVAGIVLLMTQAEVGLGAQIMGTLVLAVAAFTIEGFSRRLFRLSGAVAKADADRDAQAERFAESEASRRTIEKMLEESRTQNAALEALAAERDALTHVLVHDLRSPLTVVTYNASWVEEELARGNLSEAEIQEAREALKSVCATGERLHAMVTDLLNINKLEHRQLPMVPEMVDDRKLLETVKQHFSLMAKKKNLTVEISATTRGLLVADRQLLTRVLENLVSNAMRYTPTGGRMRIDTYDSPKGIAIAVRNDGDVIPPEVRGTLFDKFGQLGDPSQRRNAGFGLGLYFCKLVAEGHQGTMSVEDAPGWATSMVLTVPVAKAPPKPLRDHVSHFESGIHHAVPVATRAA